MEPEVRTMLTEANALQALSHARITSYERWLAATDDGDAAGTDRQAQAVSDYSLDLAHQTLVVADAIRAAVPVLSEHSTNTEVIIPDVATPRCVAAVPRPRRREQIHDRSVGRVAHRRRVYPGSDR